MSDDQMAITARELERALNVVLAEMRARHGSSFLIQHDYFWDIAPEQLYDPYQTPSDLTMGQLSDSIDWVKKVASGSGEPITHVLVWLSDVLRALGHDLT